MAAKSSRCRPKSPRRSPSAVSKPAATTSAPHPHSPMSSAASRRAALYWRNVMLRGSGQLRVAPAASPSPTWSAYPQK